MKIADKANGFSDIGVKETEQPEMLRPRAADAENETASEAPSAEERNVQSQNTGCAQSEEELEKEFEELIKTKYREAFRRRAEGIVRKRLRGRKQRGNAELTQSDLSGLAENVSDADNSENFEIPSDREEAVGKTDRAVAKARSTQMSDELVKYEKELRLKQNSVRPSENGLGGSIGMFSRTDVVKMTSKDVQDILRRASKGEKIRFDR